MKQISLSVLALAALAVSSVSAASFDASKGVQFGKAHHVARAHQDGASAKARRSTGSKAAYCAAKNSTVSVLSATTTSSVVPTTSSVAPPPETTTSTKEAPPTTSKPPPPPPTTSKPPPPATTKAASDDTSSGGGGGGRTFSPGDLTFYTPGLNACGWVDPYDAKIVAVPSQTWNSWPGFDGNSNNHPLCGKSVTITWQGKTHQATISDECGGCANGNSLDCGPTLFSQFTTLDAGRVSGMSWTLDD